MGTHQNHLIGVTLMSLQNMVQSLDSQEISSIRSAFSWGAIRLKKYIPLISQNLTDIFLINIAVINLQENVV